MEWVDSAREFAARAHAGQRDKAGHDYFRGHLVPIAAAAELFGPQVQAAAWLHDVLEDTDATTGQLAQAGVPGVVISAVEAVSRRQGETYSELIERAAGHPVGRYVKLLDNAWNITANPRLAAVDPKRAESLMRRYLRARATLLAACGLEVDCAVVRQVQGILEDAVLS